jgi:hypothetical protein
MESLFGFLCDLNFHNLSKETAWTKYLVIICECIYLNETQDENDKIFGRGHNTKSNIAYHSKSCK